MRFALILSVPLCLVSGDATAKEVTVDGLRCEYLENPAGIDTPQPRLSWKIQSRQRGAKQTAYQVLVASSPDLLAQNTGDLWDSGHVASDQSIHVPYAGKPLTSRQQCFWKVCVWSDAASAWSQPVTWSMGLLASSDWQGTWIGLDVEEKRELLEGASWIWFPEDPTPPETRYFRRVIDLPEGRTIKSAQLLTAADNAANIFVNGIRVGRAVAFKVALEIDVSDQLKPGRNVLAAVADNGGAGPNPAGLLAVLTIEFTNGQPLVIATDAAWRTANREVAGWEQPAFDDSQWVAAKVLGPAGMAPWGEVVKSENRRLPARWLRQEFQVERKVRRATVYYSGLGLSELYINGSKVGDEVLSPGLTDYPKRVFYVTHDVTDRLRAGANAIGVTLGNGRYFAPRLDSPTPTITYGCPKLLLQMDVEYDDGSTTKVISDGTWRLTTDGPILANNEYDGEEYDARMELKGWANPDFGDSRWQMAKTVAPPGGAMAAEMTPPIRVTGTIKPVAVCSPKPGVYVFDMGQNMVGWCRLHVTGPRGTEITLRHAEEVKPDGTLYLDNIRAAKVTDRYILDGEGEEQWEPRFTYHGFRYVEVRGWPGEPTLDAMEGRVVNDDLESAGQWSCSNPLLNRIHANITWGVRGNYRSIPTDCPQRDERQGWLGDRAAESMGETYLFQNAPLYAKWLQDITDSQKESGSVPDVAPAYWPFYSDNVTWPCCLIVIPGALLDQFGDTAIVARVYPAMDRWMTYMSGFLKNDLMPNDTYGDWCVPPEDPKLIHSSDPARKTAKEVLGTTYFYHCCRLMARYATVLGKTDDAHRYNELAEKLNAAFNRQYLQSDGSQYDNGSQTSCVLPLYFGMAPQENRPKIFAHLVDKISRESHDHVGTGLIGGQWLMRTLTENGRADLAYTLASQKTYPSWGYMIEQGATTIWELWNGDTADPAMNSRNHVMLVGDLCTWFYQDLAGIKPDPEQPGFKHIIMRPQVVGDLTHVEATHESMYGRIVSQWKLLDGDFQWTVVIPANTMATVYLPSAAADRVFEGDVPIEKATGVQLVGQQGDRTVVRLGAGEYHFVVKGFARK